MKITVTSKSVKNSLPKVKVGQLYKRLYDYDEDSINCPIRLFIVADILDDKFSLVEINDGTSWDGATYDINKLLSLDDFELLENVDIIISI